MKNSILIIILAVTVCYCADLETPIDNGVSVNEVPKDAPQDQPAVVAQENVESDVKETGSNSDDLATAQQFFGIGIGFGGGGYGGGWGRGYGGGYGRGYGGGWGRGFGGGYGRRFGYGGGWGWGR